MLLWICVVILAASPLQAQPKGTLAYMDAQYGFRGIRFGTPKAEVIRRLQLEPFFDGKSAVYRRENEKLSIGSVALTDVRYTFLDNRFAGVTVVAHDAVNSPSLLEVVQAAYGPGSCSGTSLCTWKGTKVEAEYKNDAVELPVFSIWSATIRNALAAAEHTAELTQKSRKAKRAAEAADDF